MGEGEREIGKWILRESINNKVDKKPKEGEGANFFFKKDRGQGSQ